jgi:hypothetical protein
MSNPEGRSTPNTVAPSTMNPAIAKNMPPQDRMEDGI